MQVTPAPQPTPQASPTPAPTDPWEQALLEAAEVCRAIHADAVHSDTLNIVLSAETIETMVDAVAELGVSVIDEDMALDMRNPTPLMNFGRSLTDEAAYYTVYADGHIGLNVLTRNALTTLSATFTDTPEIYIAAEYVLTDLTYTDKGWLIYTRDQSGSTNPKLFNVDPHTMVRVTPLSEEYRILCDTYIAPVGYSENNLFTVNWSELDCSQVDFSSLYAMLFGMTHSGETLTWYSAKSYYEQISGSDLFLIPQADLEATVQQFFSVPTAVLRSSSDYNAARQGYYFLGWQTGYYDVVPRIPVPEVVDAWENPDGTLTMQVDALFSWYGTDCAFTHEVTVQPNADGSFHYVSNKVIDRQDNLFPERQLQDRRSVAIGQL